ncbi:class I SAM-dependent methyltransferase [Williamsia sp. CHRR-6]|uniref:class I SAM-dependent methyltransferase n=1 Tax=Williamsia sp. CHRR-6 TaxID=2835871 RepID=UPI001BDA4F7C|nr:class I SAM-dependent methyltransferase [Williamsia sp. CHRR-6]MBT0566960.1 class I SAM-dependent methyltransferase [Williamsia sp. CHRR-6]
MTSARERVRDLLTVPVRDESHGYLDVLNAPAPAESLSLRVMQNPIFAEVYERAWRPVFTRLFSFGGSATADADRALTNRLSRAGDRLILDVACGPGNYTRRFGASLRGDGVAVGLDFSTPMLGRAVLDNTGPRVVYVRGDAHAIPFADNTFDTVACLAALYLVSDPLQVIDELARVVAPGGEVAVFTTVRTGWNAAAGLPIVRRLSGFRFFGRHEITGRFAEAGLVGIEQTITGQGQFVTARKPSK